MTLRHREHTWTDPGEIAALAPTTSGLEFLRAMARGEVPQPPIASTLGFRLVSADPGTVTLIATPAEFQYNAIATVHGGVIATWADTSIGYAAQTRLPEGSSLTTLDLQVRYLRPIVEATGEVTITAVTEHAGRRTATASSRITDGAGRLLATATSSCLVLPA